MQIEIRDRPQRLVPATNGKFAANWGGQFFAEVVSLDGGDYTAKVQIIFSEYSVNEQITIRVRSLSRRVTLAETNITADLTDRRKMDQIYLAFSLPGSDDIEISGHSEANCSTHLLRYITIVDGDSPDPSEFFFEDIGVPRIANVKTIDIGTTGVCNASCVHCPTNKKSRPAMPHGRMSTELFNKIIAELKDNGFSGEIRFGLFAEPLDDPLLRQRLETIKNELPETVISIATNGGLFDVKRHGFIVDYANFVGVHVESIDPEVYNEYMDPLKAERVIPRVISLLELAASKGKIDAVGITTPVHKGNFAGLPKLQEFFSRYRDDLLLTSLSNRSWEGGPYTKLSLSPHGGYCMPHFMHKGLFIDWDGALVPCCFDFSKSMVLGDLNKQSLQEIFRGEAWQALYGTFREKRWSEKEACSRCRVDHQDVVTEYVEPLVTAHVPVKEISPLAFSFNERAEREPDGSIVSPVEAEEGIVVFGPYVRLPAGHYRVHSHIEVEAFTDGICSLLFDANPDWGAPIAEARIEISGTGPLTGSLDFVLERDAALEFRIAREGPIRFKHTGAVVVNLGPYLRPEVSEAMTTASLHHEEVSIPRREMSPLAFSFNERAEREPDGSIVSPVEAENGIAVYGPYVRLPAGHYRVHSHIEVEAFTDGICALLFDANPDWDAPIAEARIEISGTGSLTCSLDFMLERDAALEFRIAREGPISFRHTGAVVVNLGPYQRPEVSEVTTADTLHDEEDSIDHAYQREFPALAFSHTDRASVGDDGSIVSSVHAQDGNIVFGPYVRLPAGRYRVCPRVDIQEFTKGASRLVFDVNETATNSVIAARRVVITDAGPVASSLSFSLERKTTVEFRVAKQGPTAVRHRGATLWSFDHSAPENTEADRLEKEFSANAFSVSALATRDPDSDIVSLPQASDGNVVYGPYISLPAGRYRVRHHIRILEKPQHGAWIETDVCADDSILAAKRLKITKSGLLVLFVGFRVIARRGR